QRLIIGNGNHPRTRRRTSLDLVLQAGPRARGVKTVRTIAQKKCLLQRRDGAVDRHRRRERPEIMPFAPPRPAMLGKLGRLVLGGDEDIGKGLVVAQKHVVAWL